MVNFRWTVLAVLIAFLGSSAHAGGKPKSEGYKKATSYMAASNAHKKEKKKERSIASEKKKKKSSKPKHKKKHH